MLRWRAMTRVLVLALLFAACTSSNSAQPSDAAAPIDATIDAAPACQPGVSDADCARCGPLPEQDGATPLQCLSDCPICPDRPACVAQCRAGRCYACYSSSSRWQLAVVDCLCTDAGP